MPQNCGLILFKILTIPTKFLQVNVFAVAGKWRIRALPPGHEAAPTVERSAGVRHGDKTSWTVRGQDIADSLGLKFGAHCGHVLAYRLPAFDP
jgi:hypothetical protein